MVRIMQVAIGKAMMRVLVLLVVVAVVGVSLWRQSALGSPGGGAPEPEDCAALTRRFEAAVAVARREHAERVWSNATAACASERRSWRPPGLSFQVIGTNCQPWWRQDAIAVVDALLSEDAVAVEWGAGSSTFWLAERVGFLHSIESSGTWGERMHKSLSALGTLNRLADKVALHVVDRGYCPLGHRCEDRERAMRYVDEALVRPDGSVDAVADLVVDDGRMRYAVMQRALTLLRPEGGVLVLDNSNRGRYDPGLFENVPGHWLRFTSATPWPDDGTLTPLERATANVHIRKDSLQTTVWLSRPAHCGPRATMSI